MRGAGIYDNFYTAAELPSFCKQLLSKNDLPLWEQRIIGFILDFLDASAFIIQESSGTTGIPKKISIPKKAMIHSAMLTAKKLRLQHGQTALLCLPVDYIAGKMMIVRALTTGMNLIWIEPSALPGIAIDKKIDFCAMVPLQVFNLLGMGRPFSHIKNLIIGGSELSPELENQFQTIPTRVFETFGMTETCSHIALRRINGPHAKPWFTVLPGVEISTDNRNCLVIQASFLSDRIVTNDVVEIVGKGNFLWKGRIDNIINSGGIKINPENLEKIIYDILGHESYLIGIPDDKLGQKLVLVTIRNYSSADKALILDKLRGLLPLYHLPADIITIASFPRNRSYKIDRTGLVVQLNKMVKKS